MRRILPVLLCVAGCREGAYRAAARVDTPLAYRQFISGNPKDDSLGLAQSRLAELEFEAASRAHTVIAYKRFLSEFPSAEQAAQVEALLETLRFTAAQQKGDAAAWRLFLREHPSGPHHEEAERLLAEAELKELSSGAEPDDLSRFAAKHPDDPRTLEVTARLDQAAWQRATSATAVCDYLRSSPAGAFRDEARVRLLSWQIQGLLVSGEVAEAKALASKAPLAARLRDLPAQLKQAELKHALTQSSDAQVQRVLSSWQLRGRQDLLKALSVGDAIDRWEAAEELGNVVSVKVIDPLLQALRDSRSQLVRQRAFGSLGRVLRALPPEVADYEVATRLESLRDHAADAQLTLTMAVLLDLSGQLTRAAAEYQRGWDPMAPDPVVLRRWAALRRERGQFFSAAVAARQLAVWAEGVVSRVEAPTPAAALVVAREACGAREAVREAVEVLEEARGAKTEFPEDVEAFMARAREVQRLVEARLRDAELLVLQDNANARTCDDPSFRQRMAEAERARLAALEDLRRARPRVLPLLLDLVRERDASEAVRRAASNSGREDEGH